MDLQTALRPIAERLPSVPVWLGHGAAISRITTRRRDAVGLVRPPHPCLVAILSGTKTVLREGVEHAFRAPALFLMAPDEAVTVVNEPDPASGLYLAAAIEFGPETLRRIAMTRLAAPARAAPALTVRPARAVVEALAHALDGLTSPAGLSEAVLQARVVELLTALVEAGHGPRLFARTLADTAARVQAVLAVDPAAPVTAEGVAQALNMSVATLRRRLRAQGTSFQRLHDDVRLAVAVRLLGGQGSVKETAAACGFASPSRFAAWYRARTGGAPSAGRRRDPSPVSSVEWGETTTEQGTGA